MDRLKSLMWSFSLVIVMVSLVAGPALGAPIVRITQPTQNQMVTGSIMITVAFQSDNTQPITRLEIYVDDTLGNEYVLASPRSQGVQSFNWDFSMAAASAHTIKARAVDASGVVGSTEITVNVTRADSTAGADRIPPVVNIYYPAQGAKVSGEIEIRAEATDNTDVKYVFFYIDGKLHKMIMNAPPFADVWDTTRLSDGAHVLQAKAMDQAENSTSSAEVTVFVENHTMTTTPPAALATPPAGNSGVPVMPPATVEPPVIPTVGNTVTPPPVLVATQPGVTQRTFGEPTLPLAAVSGAREIEMVPSRIMLARYGYVPTIRGPEPTVRTSVPGLRLAALPSIDDNQTPTGISTDIASGVALAPESLDGQMLSALSVTPRLTVPARLPSAAAVTDYGTIATMNDTAAVETMVAALTTTPRLTAPRRSIPEMEYTDVETDNASGWAMLQPALELQAAAFGTPTQRLTSPVRALVSRETIATPEMLGTNVRTVLVRLPSEAPTGAMVASLGQRTSMPALLSPRSSVVFADTDVRTLEVAVIPADARRAAIPADGRLTSPTGARVAPVARTDFEDVKILFDADALALLADPETSDGIAIAPLREIFEHTDGVLYWFPVEKRVRAVNADTEIDLTIGNPTVKVNDRSVALEVAPYIKQGRTMVPLQFIADTLDVTVTFNPQTGQICLTSNKF